MTHHEAPHGVSVHPATPDDVPLVLDLILGLAQMIALTHSVDSGRPVTAGG